MNFVVTCFFVSIPCVISVLDKALNQPCSSDADCSIAYSICSKASGTCQCTNGFTSDGSGACKSPGMACPTWEGSPNSKPGKPCVYKWDMYAGTEKHSCDASTEICYTYPKTQTASGDLEFVGHCCPKPPENSKGLAMICPLLAQDSNGTCPDLSGQPVDMAMTGDKIRTCSYITHDCLMRSGKGACCPLPCVGSSSHFSIEGKCYDTGLIGDFCTHTAQCGGRSRCLPIGNGRSKQCQCNNGKVFQEPSPHCED